MTCLENQAFCPNSTAYCLQKGKHRTRLDRSATSLFSADPLNTQHRPDPTRLQGAMGCLFTELLMRSFRVGPSQGKGIFAKS